MTDHPPSVTPCRLIDRLGAVCLVEHDAQLGVIVLASTSEDDGGRQPGDRIDWPAAVAPLATAARLGEAAGRHGPRALGHDADAVVRLWAEIEALTDAGA